MSFILGIVFFVILGLAVSPGFFWVAGILLLILFCAEAFS